MGKETEIGDLQGIDTLDPIRITEFCVIGVTKHSLVVAVRVGKKLEREIRGVDQCLNVRH